MSRILKTHPKAVQAHKDLILQCLDDKDESIRLRALDLLSGMVGFVTDGGFFYSVWKFNNYNYISFIKLPWPRDSEGTFRSPSQSATCPPV